MNDQIYQTNPILSKPSMFRPKGWTESIQGYLHDADSLARCITLNRKYTKKDYAYAVSINIEIEMPPHQITELWTKTCRKLRKHKVIALWVREPSKTNRCNYHLIVRSPIDHTDLEAAIEDAMPVRAIIPWHKQIKPVISQYHYPRYMLKAKTSGYFNNMKVEDHYRKKRLMFISGLGLKKYGTIGKFWAEEKTRASLWQEIKDVEGRIGKGLEAPGIEQLAKHVSKLLGEPLKDVKRSLGYYANAPTVKQWVKDLQAG